MLSFRKRLPLIILVGLVVLTLPVPTARTAYFRVGAVRGPRGNVAYGYRYGGYRGGFYRPWRNAAVLATNAYANAADLYSGYLSGAAAATQGYGGYPDGYGGGYYPPPTTFGSEKIKYQEAYLLRQQVQSAKIDNRRKAFDEWLYERDKRPTTEDDRERARIESVRRAFNDPPITEIWSGQALNNLLDAIQKMDKQQGPGPNVPIDPNVLRNVNVTAGGVSGSLGLLKNGGRLQWPLVLRRQAYADDRKLLDGLASDAFQQAQSGSVSPDGLDGMNKAIDRLSAELKRHVSDVGPNEYIAAKRYLNDLSDTVTALQDPKVSNYATGKWSATGNTVSQLVANMSRDGLRFGPATPGDQAAYVSLHNALVSYYSWPEKSWDLMTK